MFDENHPAKVALFGAAGRMGSEILRQAWRYPRLKIVTAYDVAQTGEALDGVVIEAPAEVLPEDINVIIDFSSVAAVRHNLDLALAAGIPFLTGVTGLSEDMINEMRSTSNEIPVFYTPNLSPGMNTMFRIAAAAAKALPHYERHILEIHHTEKKDAPSGTALKLSAAIEEVVSRPTEITALRLGDVTGEHRFLLAGPGEQIEIIHRAQSRAVFAVGALRAAEWLLDKSAGMYSMMDVLEL